MKVPINRIRLTNDAEDDDEDDDGDGHEHVNSGAKVGDAVPKVLSTLEMRVFGEAAHSSSSISIAFRGFRIFTQDIYCEYFCVRHRFNHSSISIGVISIVKLTPSAHLSRGPHS